MEANNNGEVVSEQSEQQKWTTMNIGVPNFQDVSKEERDLWKNTACRRGVLEADATLLAFRHRFREPLT